MENKKLTFEDFVADVDDGCKDFVKELHNDLTENGCKLEIKEAKSGLVVSYLLNKKTIANYVFRKKGVIIRLYANHVDTYMQFLETLPEGMTKAIIDAPICKRLVNPDDCNSRCSMGYDFNLNGERYKKCRYSAFMFLLCEQNNSFIKSFLKNELNSCKA